MNRDAFSSPDTVKNILIKLFRRELSKYGLNIEIEKMFDAKDFWGLIKKYEGKIKRLEFKFIKPNLADIAKTLPTAFRDFQEKTNGHKGKIMVEAPEKGVLENIDQSNKAIEGLVEYSAEGGGNVAVKIKGFRRTIHTEEKAVTLQIAEVDLEGAPQQVIKLYKAIIENENH